MKIKTNYFIIPLVAILVSLLGGYFTSQGVNIWYRGLVLPSFTPPGYVIGMVWTILYILATIACLIVFNKIKDNKDIIRFFIINAFLNMTWSWIFFVLNLLLFAFFWAILLGLSVLVIMLLSYKKSKLVAWLMFPYLIWVFFASYLNLTIYFLNK